MNKRNRKDRIKTKDIIVIKNPQMFVRCGYPLCLKDVISIIMSSHLSSVQKLISEVLESDNDDSIICNSKYDKCSEDIIRALASEYIKNKNFGGKERRIHTIYDDSYMGKFAVVDDIKVRITGDYHKGYGGYSYDGEYDYCPPYLGNQKSHRILILNNICDTVEEALNYKRINPFVVPFCSDSIMIEDCHVEKCKI